jgi:hypothetical protein
LVAVRHDLKGREEGKGVPEGPRRLNLRCGATARNTVPPLYRGRETLINFKGHEIPFLCFDLLLDESSGDRVTEIVKDIIE